MGRGSGLQLFLYLKRVREVEKEAVGEHQWDTRQTREARACAHWGHARVDLLIVLPRETMEELLTLL